MAKKAAPPSTPTARLLERIGWTVPELAFRTAYPVQTIYTWYRGRNARNNPSTPPREVLAYLAQVADAIDAIPAPFRATIKS